MLIDTHCHILSSEYENLDEVIKLSFDNNLDKMIINGFDLDSSDEAVELSKKYDNIYSAVGIGPENVDNVTTNDIERIRELTRNKKVVAIGEIGLDYYWTKDTKEKQIFVFKEMLKIAKECNLPVIVHLRNATLDTYNLLKEYNVTGVMHCYSGSLDMAKEFIKLGFLIGVGGVVTFKNAKEIKNVVTNIDIKNMVLETDSPYLSPEPNRGKKNIPSNVYFVAEKIADLKGIGVDEVISITGKSACTKFDL